MYLLPSRDKATRCLCGRIIGIIVNNLGSALGVSLGQKPELLLGGRARDSNISVRITGNPEEEKHRHWRQAKIP